MYTARVLCIETKMYFSLQQILIINAQKDHSVVEFRCSSKDFGQSYFMCLSKKEKKFEKFGNLLLSQFLFL